MIMRIIDLDTVKPGPLPADVEQRAQQMVQPELALRFRQRRTAILTLAKTEGLGLVHWGCPQCQGTDHGKPAVYGASISTSSHGRWLLVAIDHDQQAIGVDITAAKAPAEAEGIARLMFTTAELRQSSPGGWADGDGFARIWSAKEALGKAHGTGLSVDGSVAYAELLDTQRHRSMLTWLEGLPPGLVGCLAVLKSDSGQSKGAMFAVPASLESEAWSSYLGA